jgi:hypothetical protein
MLRRKTTQSIFTMKNFSFGCAMQKKYPDKAFA